MKRPVAHALKNRKTFGMEQGFSRNSYKEKVAFSCWNSVNMQMRHEFLRQIPILIGGNWENV